jgi:hypothetical protein
MKMVSNDTAMQENIRREQLREMINKPNKTLEEQAFFDKQLLNAFGADSIEEAMTIA